MNHDLRIGISGSPESTPRSGSEHAVARCAELGIRSLEMAWVHRVSIKEPSAQRIRAAAEEHDVRLSVHAPYYINLNSHEDEKLEASIQRVVDSARAASWTGARDVVLHLAWYHDDDRAVVANRVAAGLIEARNRLGDEAPDVVLRPELMGKHSQYGDLDEILALCAEIPGCEPCIDIAHLHARTAAWNTVSEFEDLWDRVAEALGGQALKNVHVHISGIQYGHNGEEKHLAFEEADLDYRGFMQVIADRGIEGTVIVESPAREDDVRLLMDCWAEILASATVPAAAKSGG